MHRSIVCGIDDSTHARAAARLTFALAERLSLRPVLVHAVASVIPPMPVMPARTYAGRSELREAVQEAGRLLLDEAQAAGGADVEVRLDSGRPAQCLAIAAEEEQAELMVVGTQGNGAPRTALLGSVSLETVRDAPCPVVVVPPGAAGTGTVPLDGERVLCGVGGDDDRAGARLAERLARGLGLGLTVAHVTPPARDGTGAPVPPGTSSRSERLKAEGRAVLRAVGRALDGPYEARLCSGTPEGALDELSVRERAALVVVGTRGYGPLRSGLMGSVSRRLACHGSRPLVVCR